MKCGCEAFRSLCCGTCSSQSDLLQLLALVQHTCKNRTSLPFARQQIVIRKIQLEERVPYRNNLGHCGKPVARNSCASKMHFRLMNVEQLQANEFKGHRSPTFPKAIDDSNSYNCSTSHGPNHMLVTAAHKPDTQEPAEHNMITKSENRIALTLTCGTSHSTQIMQK